MFTILCEIADVFSGYPFRGTIPADENGDVHVVQVRDTRATGEVFQDEMVKVILPGKKAPNWLRSGDVLFVAKGVKHFAALVEDLPVNTVCSPHFFLIRVKPEYQNRVKPEFICWQLNQLPAQRYFSTTAEGSLHLSVRRQVLENTPLKLLDIKDQQLIADMHKCALKERAAMMQLIKNKDKEQTTIALKLLN
ncbi:restriction endonuclease subunit S [Pseudoalteromonas sp. Z1A8]|uniref:restriction endonuclease subunit S n=1 Tax=Pseudoalteromonas sp. Z1A8 TaxID=2686354 RepID=UPI001408A5BA|nr:restriction endonuclease subunit S [Pseudoalteromonas sp. Z1A8]